MKDRILQYFKNNRRLRILFFFDSEGEMLEELKKNSGIEEDSLTIMEFDGSWFDTQLKLENEIDSSTRVILYMKMKKPETQEELLAFPLLDLLTANQDYRSEDWAEFMQRYGLCNNVQPLVKRYIGDLSRPKCLDIAGRYLNATDFTKDNLSRILISYYLGQNFVLDWDDILIKIVSMPANDCEKLLIALDKVFDGKHPELAEIFYVKLRRSFGFGMKEGTMDELKTIIESIKYNSIMGTLATIGNDQMKKLRISDEAVQGNIARLRDKALNNRFVNPQFRETIRMYASDVEDDHIAFMYGAYADYGYYTLSLCQSVFRKFMNEVEGNPKSVNEVISKLIDNQRVKIEEIDGLGEYVRDIALYYITKQQAGTFRLDEPEDYLKSYTTKWYKLDLYYRRACAVKINRENGLDEEINKLQQKLDADHARITYLLNSEWMRLMTEKGGELTSLPAPMQWNFFNDYVKTEQGRTAVIIVDAMRYEIAEDITDMFDADVKNPCKYDLQYQIATLPSETKFGKAALLPHKWLNYEENGAVTIDEHSSAESNNRQAVLQTAVDNAHSISFEEIYNMPVQSKRRAYFKDVDKLVYIWHNRIDTSGHSDQGNLPTICKEEADKLFEVAKSLIRSCAVNKVIITSDHGFLYNRMEIADKDKQQINENFKEKTLRYYITDSSADVDLCAKVPFTMCSYVKSDLNVCVPLSTNRFKGDKALFMHGGATLEELITPVLIITDMKNDSSTQKNIETVKPLLNSYNRNIVSSQILLEFVQDNPVSMLMNEETYTVGIYDGDKLVMSKEHIMRMNRRGETPQERLFPVLLTVTKPSNSNILRLLVCKKSDTNHLNPFVNEILTNDTLVDRDEF